MPILFSSLSAAALFCVACEAGQAAVVPPPTTTPGIASKFGLNTYQYWNHYASGQRQPSINAATSLEARHLRIDLRFADWLETEPADRPMNFWGHFKSIDSQVRLGGIQPLFGVLLSSDGSIWPRSAPEQDLLRSFAQELWANLPSAWIQVENEVNLFRGGFPATTMSDIDSLAACVTVLAAGKGAGKVLAPSLTTFQESNGSFGLNPDAVLSRIVSLADSAIDRYAFHLYVDGIVNSDAALSDMPESKFNSILRLKGLIRGKPFSITEAGYASYTAENGVTETRQADRGLRSFLLSVIAGAEHVYLYELRDRENWCQGTGSTTCETVYSEILSEMPQELHFGVLRSDLSRKPWATKMVQFFDDCGDFSYESYRRESGRWTVTLRKGSQTIEVRWAETQSAVSPGYSLAPSWTAPF